ncbi:argininosuccinate synthase, partial [Candidatus Peregrinibacteria bacterium]|nr:argininosuccinate synthase [Candidatus Peregrinibacteria bacterium]
MKKAILAFSGGLDTSFLVPYLKEKGLSVITVTVNTGGFDKKELKEIAIKSKKLGSLKHYEIDATKVLYEKFASYIIKSNYLKGGVYPACVGPERLVIAMELAKIAQKENSNILVHGSTGAGNDQVRFDLTIKALCPKAMILAPIREHNFSREYESEFLKKHGHKVTAFCAAYSVNVGLLGTTIGGKETKNTYEEIPESIFPTVTPLDKTPEKSETITIKFKNGLPESKDKVAYINKLNKIAAKHGYGKDYHIGTTIIGLKGKIAFEAPALKLLIKAHSELEKAVLTSKEIFWKNTLGQVYGDMIHEGLYFDPLIQDIEAFMDSASQNVSGEVNVKLHKGTITVSSIKSPHSLFNSKLGTYGENAGAYTGTDAAGFCKLYGLESI